MLEYAAKLIPLITIAGGTAATSPQIKAQIGKIVEATKVVATQMEVNDIAKMVYLDVIADQAPKPTEFEAYLKANMKTRNGIHRNTSQDFWGTTYGLAYDSPNHVLYVISAGPDKTFNDSDDVFSSFAY
jgi:hypothetical protein